MTKSRKVGKYVGIPVLGVLKEGLNLIKEGGRKLICVVRKVKFGKGEVNEGGDKYVRQKYSLFSRFDEGIMLDEESWFSVTHEVIANHIANTCQKCSIVMDGFAGAGGNVIAFAKHCPVLAVDVDLTKLSLLQNNAEIYKVSSKIASIHSDFLKVCQKADVVFASPPWGGPSYIQSAKFNFKHITPSFSLILQKCSELSKNFIIYLPKNLDPIDLFREIQNSGIPITKIELQVYYIGKKIKGIACFCGDIVRPNSWDVEKLELAFNNG